MRQIFPHQQSSTTHHLLISTVVHPNHILLPLSKTPIPCVVNYIKIVSLISRCMVLNQQLPSNVAISWLLNIRFGKEQTLNALYQCFVTKPFYEHHNQAHSHILMKITLVIKLYIEENGPSSHRRINRLLYNLC